jgi:hypothetical protein
MKTAWIGGNFSSEQAGFRYLLGPAHCKGEHLSEKMGSIIRLVFEPIEITAVE